MSVSLKRLILRCLLKMLLVTHVWMRQIAKKIEIFQRKMINVATSMISAIEQFHSSEKNAHATGRISDCNNVFQQKDTISSQRDSAQRPNVQRRYSVSSVPVTRARGQTAAQNIPGVIGVSRKERTNYGIQRDSNTSDLPHSESHRRPTQPSASRNEGVVIGSSLVSGLGSKLCSEGLKPQVIRTEGQQSHKSENM